MNYADTLGNSLSSVTLLLFLIKVLAIVFIIALIAAALVWIKNFFEKTNTDREPNPAASDKGALNINSVAWALLGGLGFLLLLNLLGLNTYYLLTVSLILLAKIFMLVLVVSLIIAAILYLKSQTKISKTILSPTTVSGQNEIHSPSNETNI